MPVQEHAARRDNEVANQDSGNDGRDLGTLFQHLDTPQHFWQEVFRQKGILVEQKQPGNAFLLCAGSSGVKGSGEADVAPGLMLPGGKRKIDMLERNGAVIPEQNLDGILQVRVKRECPTQATDRLRITQIGFVSNYNGEDLHGG
jgi:hypothetical protein